jgi:hypothetical protein
MTTKKYWCPMCGDVPTTPTMGIALLVTHKADCIGFHAIPVVEPLDVPEETTWGESGGAEAGALGRFYLPWPDDDRVMYVVEDDDGIVLFARFPVEDLSARFPANDYVAGVRK